MPGILHLKTDIPNYSPFFNPADHPPSQLQSTLTSLATSPQNLTVEIAEGLRHLERKVASVYTLMKASVYSIVLQQGEGETDLSVSQDRDGFGDGIGGGGGGGGRGGYEQG